MNYRDWIEQEAKDEERERQGRRWERFSEPSERQVKEADVSQRGLTIQRCVVTIADAIDELR
jgi:hypothetical protein